MALRWKSVDKELVFRYTNTAKPVPAGSLLPFWKNHHFQHKMDRRSVGHSDPVQPTESHMLPGAAEAPASSKSNHRTRIELNSRRWVVSPKKLHNKDFSAVTGALPAACTLLSFPRAWQSGEDRIISYSFKSSSALTFTLANYERLCLCRWTQHGLQCQQEPARGSI